MFEVYTYVLLALVINEIVLTIIHKSVDISRFELKYRLLLFTFWPLIAGFILLYYLCFMYSKDYEAL